MRRAVSTLATACCLAALTACGDSGGSAANTTLRQALGRIMATDDTRTMVAFDDTATLVTLAGREPGATGYGQLRGAGAGNLASYAQLITDKPGIRLLDASYTITAGTPPHQLGLIAGGQHADTVTQGLTSLGWHPDNGQLKAPALGAVNDENLGTLALPLAQLRTDGADLIYGNTAAHLDAVRSRSTLGTLADDPTIGALAGCLGTVVAAVIATPKMSGKLHPTAIALGVRAPAHNTDTPHMIGCLSWSSAGDATQYHTLLDRALREGASIATNQSWKDILTNTTTRDTGGDAHVVAWEADTPNSQPARGIQMLNNLDLPAFPCTDRMPPQVRAQFPDYC
jgi:hypothetical protein